MKSNSNFLLLFFGRLVSRLGDSVFTIGMSWYILKLTGSSVQMASVIAVMTLTMIIAGPIGGNIVDQFPKVKLLYTMDFIRSIAVIGTAITITFSSNVTLIILVIYVTTIVSALCTVIFNPASSAAIPLIMTKEELMKANSFMAISGSLTDIFGIALGGIIYSLVGPLGIVLIDAISYLLSGVSETFIRLDEKITTKEKSVNPLKEQFQIFKEGLGYLKVKRGLIFIGLFAAVLNFSLNPTFRVYQPFLIENVLSKDIIYLAYILIATSTGMLAAGLLLSFTNIVKKDVNIVVMLRRFTMFLILLFALLTAVVSGANKGGMSFTLFMITYGISSFFVGACVAFINIPVETYIQKNTEPSMMGRVNGVINMMAMISSPVAVMMGGVMLKFVSIELAYGISAVILFLSGGFILTRKELLNFEEESIIAPGDQL